MQIASTIIQSIYTFSKDARIHWQFLGSAKRFLWDHHWYAACSRLPELFFLKRDENAH